ncbi:MAG: undecaprenyl-diphosphate phosphatase [Proteobacteria bacterium]|nr:undecaprenyl-diphosphate phosphatase [Pseudomonadota bacterium]NOG61050.1 undecaprenyl-diphosphate phosphatase [Pseudomonadota bacterium]
MDLLQLIILSLIQGITEFLPVSSSAHLILVPLLTQWQDQGLAIDVAAHLGSLFAVILYFRKDISRILLAGINSIIKKGVSESDGRLFWYIVIGSMPVLVCGFLLHDVVSTYLREPLIIALTSIGFGLLLLYADLNGKRIRQINSINMRDVIIIGLAQALALIPGTSRSGITMTAALMLGLDRNSAARFSFLMAVPIILAAGGYELLKLVQTGEVVDLENFLITVCVSAISAFISIHLFLKFLENTGMLPFVVYRVVLGIVLFYIFI